MALDLRRTIEHVASKSGIEVQGPMMTFGTTGIGWKLIDMTGVHRDAVKTYRMKATFVIPTDEADNRRFVVERTEAAIIALQHMIVTGFEPVTEAKEDEMPVVLMS